MRNFKKIAPKIFKEPLFLFSILGILLFVLYSRIADTLPDSEKKIEVSAPQVEMLAQTFTKTWNRNPTREELEGQIQSYVKDEVFYREAMKMGLNENDPAIKRRMRQMLEFMMDDFAQVYPTESQLREYLAANPEKFRRSGLLSFSQYYFSDDEHDLAEETLKSLSAKSSVVGLEKRSLMMVPTEFQKANDYEIERLFGNAFSDEVMQLSTDTWHGPIRSGYGWHLVFINEKTDGGVPDLTEIWDEVEREWSNEMRQKIKEEQYAKLRANYEVEIEFPARTKD